MSKNNNNYQYEEHAASSRFANDTQGPNYDPRYAKYNGFSSRREAILASLQNYFGNCKTMLISSISHMISPSTIIVILFLVALYIILGVTGNVDYAFSIRSEGIREMNIKLDIIVNALLGFFYGPATSCISSILCTLVKMAVSGDSVFGGYVLLAGFSGFLHGWILYRHKTMWFGTRFRGFFSYLLVKCIITRLVVSIIINVLLKGIIYKISIGLPLSEYILYYNYSNVALTSFSDFTEVFVAGFIVDTFVIYFAMIVINFIASKAFPVQYAQPELLIDENGALINLEEEIPPSQQPRNN